MFERMSRGDKIAGGGAIVLVVSLFLPWYGFDFSAVDVPNNGFSKLVEGITLSGMKALDYMDIMLLLIGVGIVAVLFLMANGNLDDSLRSWIETAGSFAALAVIFRMFDQPDPAQLVVLKYGIYAALIGALAIAVGGWLNRTDGVV